MIDQINEIRVGTTRPILLLLLFDKLILRQFGNVIAQS